MTSIFFVIFKERRNLFSFFCTRENVASRLFRAVDRFVASVSEIKEREKEPLGYHFPRKKNPLEVPCRRILLDPLEFQVFERFPFVLEKAAKNETVSRVFVYVNIMASRSCSTIETTTPWQVH